MQISSKTEAHSQKKQYEAVKQGQKLHKKRLDYWESIRDVLADDLVFVDEMGVLLGLMRGMGRSKEIESTMSNLFTVEAELP